MTYLRNQSQALDLPALEPLRKKNALPDIIIFSIIDWDFRIQRPQHLANALAKQGHRVFYVSNNFLASAYPGLDVKLLSDTLPLYWIKLGLKDAPAIYEEKLSPQGLQQLIKGLSVCLRWADINQVIALVQHPFWTDLAFTLPNCRVIYDCMDHHAGFNETTASVLAKEAQLLKEAQLVLATSKNLYDEVIKYNNSVALIRNAADYDFFSVEPDNVYSHRKFKKIIGYYGAIAEWFDIDLVAALAKAFPDYGILLIGRDTADIRKKLKFYKNIIFAGEIAYDRLLYYLYAFDVCIIPFKVIPLTLATNPVKAYEYLSAGKPVVSVDLPELHEFSDLIQLADSHQTFIQQVNIALGENSPEKIAERKKFALTQTWDSRILEFEKALDKIKEPLVSIIILAYNNLALTQACLKSIEQYTDYENIEIIIVDNASTDNTPDFLRKNYQAQSKYKVILNTENKGFSAGNNIGLKAATGDYLVLLNNDTRVTPGWLRTLVNHFRHNSNLGLLGPVTNNIGNEAKIFTQYQHPDDMFPEVTELILKNMGKLTPLKTAAFFCVMMPRKVFEKVGLLDESFGLGFFEDDDYCRRVAQAGYEIYCADDVFVHHHLSASFDKLKIKMRQALFEKNKKIYESKWGPWQPHQYRSETKKTILCIIGTRPEAIKMAPVIWALQKEDWVNTRVLITAQHRKILDQMLSLFGIQADLDLDIMKTNQTLSELTSRLIEKMNKVIQAEKPDMIIGQGDTTTVFAAALSSFYHHIPFAHVEAGLRTYDLYNPFPEEANRLLTAQLASLHFAPTLSAQQALLKENIAASKIYTTGNTVIDALLSMTAHLQQPEGAAKNKKLILVTAHRRENFGRPFANICKAIKKIADECSDVQIVYPVHPNPQVHHIAHQELGDHPHIKLLPPLGYAEFVSLMAQCYCILTDSGGIQEEAPALGKPVLVLRHETERPEAVEAGVVKLVGTSVDSIFSETQKLLTDANYYASMSKGISPYGDGKAARRIVSILREYLQ